MDPGLYFVTLNNENPISVNAHDPRRADSCIRVNHLNCKIGKTKDLETRGKDYFKTFGEENVNFMVLARLWHIKGAEDAIMAELDNFRIRGATSRKNEWLENIRPETVIEIVINTLKRMEHEGRIAIHSWGGQSLT